MNPLLPLFLAYVGGILFALPAARLFLFPSVVPSAIVLAAAGLVLLRKKHGAFIWILLACFLAIGYAAPGLPDRFRPESHILNHLREGEPAEVSGNIVQPPLIYPERTRYVVELTSIRYGENAVPVSGLARITVYAEAVSPLQLGDAVRFEKTRLKRPRNFKNPGRFDYKRYMDSAGISVAGNTSHPPGKTGTFPVSLIVAYRDTFKQKMYKIIDRYLPASESALLKGIFLSETQFLSDAVTEHYRATGLTHILSVSGLHVGIVAAAAFFLMYSPIFHFLVKYFPNAASAGIARKLTALFTLVPILFYSLLVGAKVPALRAGMMVVMFLLAVLVERANKLFNALLLAAFVLLIWNPKAILDVGFQLSFTAVFSILFAVHYLTRWEKTPLDRLVEPGWYQKLLSGTVLVSFAASLGTLPMLIFYFNRISLSGFILNPVLVPISSLLLPLAFIALTLGLAWEPLASVCMPILSLLLKVFLIVPEYFASIPYSSIYVPTPPHIWFILYYVAFFGGIYWYHRQRSIEKKADAPPVRWLNPLKYGLAFCALWVGIWFFWPRFPQPTDDKLTVAIIDVGEGDSIYIEFPNHKIMLIDGGGFPGKNLDVGRMVAAPFLWNRGFGKIDYMAATHSDNDHISGLESLLDLFKVNYLLLPETGIADKRLARLKQKALDKNAASLALETGKYIREGDVTITLLHPDPGFTDSSGPAKKAGRERVGNDYSLTLRVDYRQFSMLFTGDIGKKAEAYLVKNRAPLLRTDFLKGPHHGSKHSSTPEFIQTVQPKEVFFSAGYLNQFHHPAPDVVKRYEAMNVHVWRTDRDGAVFITTDGYNHKIKTHEDL